MPTTASMRKLYLRSVGRTVIARSASARAVRAAAARRTGPLGTAVVELFAFAIAGNLAVRAA